MCVSASFTTMPIFYGNPNHANNIFRAHRYEDFLHMEIFISQKKKPYKCKNEYKSFSFPFKAFSYGTVLERAILLLLRTVKNMRESVYAIYKKVFSKKISPK